MYRRMIRMARGRLLLAILLAGASGCGDDDPTGPIGRDVQGVWARSTGTAVHYLSITRSTITLWTDAGDCYDRERLEVVAATDSVYTVVAASTSDTLRFVLAHSPGQLRAGAEGGPLQTYLRSDVELATLTPCGIPAPGPGAGGDPSIQCDTLPPLPVNGSVVDSLIPLDRRNPQDQRLYDLYRLDLPAAGQVTITQRSIDFDGYLYLYEAGGSLIAADDDGASGLDPRIVETLPAGCHRVEATTYYPHAFGYYEIIVSRP